MMMKASKNILTLMIKGHKDLWRNDMIRVTSCGHDSHHRKPCDIEHEHGLSEYLLLIVKTSAWFYIDGRRICTEPNMVILFDRDTYIRYGCDKPDYNDDWIHFSIPQCEEGDSLFASLGISLNQPLYPPDIQRLSSFIRLMAQEFHCPSSQSAQVLHCLMKALLYALGEDLLRADHPAFQHRHYSAFLRLRTSLYNDPGAAWTTEALARSLNLSVSHFQHLYKYFFHTSPQMDIIHARLDLAKFYLSNSNMSIYALALFCGYQSDVHFMRQFKKFVGMTPTEFRKLRYLTPPA